MGLAHVGWVEICQGDCWYRVFGLQWVPPNVQLLGDLFGVGDAGSFPPLAPNRGKRSVLRVAEDTASWPPASFGHTWLTGTEVAHIPWEEAITDHTGTRHTRRAALDARWEAVMTLMTQLAAYTYITEVCLVIGFSTTPSEGATA